MSFAYKKLNRSDVTSEQYTSNKGYSASLDDLLESGYDVVFGQKPVSGALFDPINSPKNPNGSYRELVYEGIKHLYYYNYITGSLTGSFFRSSSYDNFDQTTLVSGNLDTVIKQFPSSPGYRDLYDSTSFYNTDSIYDGSNSANIVVLDFSKNKFGSGLYPGSFKISSSQYLIKDDGLGNLYAYTSSLFQADYSNPESEYNEVVYGPDFSSLTPFITDTDPHKTYIGNIIYSHGVAIITHHEFLCVLGSAPVAINNNIVTSNVSCSKVLDILGNDFDDCYNIDPLTIDFHSISGSYWPFNYTLDANGFMILTPDEISTTPGTYKIGYTVKNELERTSNSASVKLVLEESPLTGSLIGIENVCYPDQFGDVQQISQLAWPTGAVTFSIDYGVPYYSWSNDNTNYTPVPDLCQPIVSGTVSASFDGFIYVKDRNENIYSMSYSNVFPTISLNITTASVGWCVHTPYVPPTPSPTPSISVSITPTISISRTPSKTPSISPSQNNNPSATPSATPSRTASNVASPSRTPSITRTPSVSFLCGTYSETLRFGVNSLDACTGNSDVFYTNNAQWWNSTILKSYVGCNTVSARWVSDGSIVRYWNGSTWGGPTDLCAGGGGSS